MSDNDLDEVVAQLRRGLWPEAADAITSLRAEVERLRTMLQAARDHLKFEANSDSGLVARIDRALEAKS